MSLATVSRGGPKSNGGGGGGIEKYSSYFASMNPLSAKIYSDIQAVQESAVYDPDLTYSQKCALIDKSLITDRIHRTPQKPRIQHVIEQPIYGNMTSLSTSCPSSNGGGSPNYQDHYSQLMLSVYPKRPERIIYDEKEDEYWLDEHSEPFSFCNQSQVNFCELGDFVKSLPMPPHEILQQQQQERMKRIGSSFQQQLQMGVAKMNGGIEPKKEEPTRRKAFGVPISIPSIPKVLKPIRKKPPAPKPPPRADDSRPIFPAPIDERKTPTHADLPKVAPTPPPKPRRSSCSSSSSSAIMTASDDEGNLPNQKQNLDLIAELQAKLKLGKPNVNGVGASNVNVQHKTIAPPPPPNKKPNIKPRAPPPPPPRKPSSASECSSSSSQGEKEDALRTQPRDQLQSELERKFYSKFANEDDEFKVDVSSPCKIATPRTGFDFLDNW